MEFSNFCLVFNLDDDLLSGCPAPATYSDWTLMKIQNVVSSVAVRGLAGTGFRTYPDENRLQGTCSLVEELMVP